MRILWLGMWLHFVSRSNTHELRILAASFVLGNGPWDVLANGNLTLCFNFHFCFISLFVFGAACQLGVVGIRLPNSLEKLTSLSYTSMMPSEACTIHVPLFLRCLSIEAICYL